MMLLNGATMIPTTNASGWPLFHYAVTIGRREVRGSFYAPSDYAADQYLWNTVVSGFEMEGRTVKTAAAWRQERVVGVVV